MGGGQISGKRFLPSLYHAKFHLLNGLDLRRMSQRFSNCYPRFKRSASANMILEMVEAGDNIVAAQTLVEGMVTWQIEESGKRRRTESLGSPRIDNLELSPTVMVFEMQLLEETSQCEISVDFDSLPLPFDPGSSVLERQRTSPNLRYSQAQLYRETFLPPSADTLLMERTTSGRIGGNETFSEI